MTHILGARRARRRVCQPPRGTPYAGDRPRAIELAMHRRGLCAPQRHSWTSFETRAPVPRLGTQYVKACRDEFEDIAREYDTASKLADLESLCAERGVLEGIPAEALATAEGPRPAAEAMRARYEAMTREREVLREVRGVMLG